MKQHEAGFMFLAAGGEAHARHPSEIFTATDARILFEELRKSLITLSSIFRLSTPLRTLAASADWWIRIYL